MKLLALFLSVSLFGQSPSQWKDIEFLVGEWVGEGDGTPGRGVGDYSFRTELNGQIVVRRSFNQMANARHEDLMVIHRDGGNGAMRATYWDTEGHTIHYLLTVEKLRAVFESDASQPGPRYRLTYTSNGKTLEGKFEVAAPKTEYKTYLAWTSRRK